MKAAILFILFAAAVAFLAAGHPGYSVLFSCLTVLTLLFVSSK